MTLALATPPPAPDALARARRRIFTVAAWHATTLAALTPAAAADARIARALDALDDAAAQLEAARLSVARDEVTP